MGTIQIDGSTPKLTIGNATAEDATILFDGNAQDFYIALDDSADDLLIGLGSTVGTTPAISIDENVAVKTYGDITMTGTTPVLTIGDAGAEDTAIVFDGNAQDFYIALDDSADDLVIGLGSTVGTTPAISINEDRDVTISDGAIDFDVASHDGTNGLKLGGTLVTTTAAELNLLDGGTSVGSSITLADADGFVVNDGGTMKTIPASDISTYAGGGKILQVQSVSLTGSNTQLSSTTFGATEVTDQITPSADSSKVLVMMSLIIGMYEASGTGNFCQAAVYRSIDGGTYAKVGFGNVDNAYSGQGGFDAGTEVGSNRPLNMIFVDSPNTTDTVDYKLYIRLSVASGGGDNVNTGPSNLQRSVTLMEIGA